MYDETVGGHGEAIDGHEPVDGQERIDLDARVAAELAAHKAHLKVINGSIEDSVASLIAHDAHLRVINGSIQEGVEIQKETRNGLERLSEVLTAIENAQHDRDVIAKAQAAFVQKAGRDQQLAQARRRSDWTLRLSWITTGIMFVGLLASLLTGHL